MCFRLSKIDWMYECVEFDDVERSHHRLCYHDLFSPQMVFCDGGLPFFDIPTHKELAPAMDAATVCNREGRWHGVWVSIVLAP